MIDFVRYRKWFYLVTLLLVAGTVVALITPPRLPWGLEFTSGSALEVRFIEKPNATPQEIQANLEEIGLKGSIVQAVGEKGYFIRTPRVEDDLEPVLEERFGEVAVTSLEGGRNLALVVSFTDPVPEAAVREALEAPGTLSDARVLKTNDGRFLIGAEGGSSWDVRRALEGMELRYGPAELLDFQGSEHMALLLDFGPAVPSAEFQKTIEGLHSTLQSFAAGENSFFVAATLVPGSVRGSLITTLEAVYGKARTTLFDRPEDMALVLSFPQRPSIEDFRSELLAQQAFGAMAVPQGESEVVLVGKDYTTDQRDRLFTALRTKFGELERRPFSFGAGLATVVDFGRTVNQLLLNQRLRQINSAAVGLDLGESKFFVGGRAIAEEQRASILSGLEASLGLSQQSSVDFSQLLPLDVRFTDPLQLADVLHNLAVIPVTDAVGDRAKVQAAGTGRFLVLSTTLLQQEQRTLIADLERAIGRVETTEFEGVDDMRLVLDFGPRVSTAEVRSVINSVDRTILLESTARNKFLIIGTSVITDRQTSVLELLEQRFGPAKRATFQDAGDIAWVITPEKDTPLGTVRSAVAGSGVSGVAVAPGTSGTFHLFAEDVREDKKTSLLTSLREALGRLRQTQFDFGRGMAVGVDFGESPDLKTLRNLVGDSGFESIYVETAGTNSFFLGGEGVPQARQDDLVSRFEAGFGLAKRQTFAGPQDFAAIVAVTDDDQLAQAIKQSVVVHKLGPNEFFLGQAGISALRREQVLSALQAGLGEMRQQTFDFNLGLATNVTFAMAVSPNIIRSTLEAIGYTGLVIEPRGGNSYFIRSDRPEAGKRNQLIQGLEATFGAVDRQHVEFSFVDPEIARRSVLNTSLAVAFSFMGILLYVWFAFRRAPKPFRYGVATLIAILHDVVIVVGVFALMAKFRHVEIDSLMVIGVLAVIGFSVNNTIVVIDRVRENLGRFPNRSFDDTVNISLNETLSRNLNTTATTCLAILAVLFFGGPTIFNFMLLLMTGILSGMYSSLFLATPTLVSWEKGEFKIFRRRRVAQGAP